MTPSTSRVQFDRRDYRMDTLPEGIAIEPVMGCNLRCPMCAVPDAPRSMGGRKPTLMGRDLYRRIIREISDRPRSVMLTIMGEPLLHPEIVDFVAMAKQAGHHTALITNGTKLTSRLSAALLDAGLDFLAMSVDGLTKRTYESLRVGAAHERVIHNLRELIRLNAERRSPMRVDLNYVVTSRTEHERDAFYREFAPLVRKVNFIPLCDWGGQLDVPAALVPSSAEDCLISQRSPLAAASGTPVTPESARLPCYALWGTMFISAEGRAMLCCSDFRYTANLPSVEDRPLLDIWRTEVQAYRRAHLRDDFDQEPCRSCRINAVAYRMPPAQRRQIIRNERLARLRRRLVPEALLPDSVKQRRERREVPFGSLDVPVPGAVVSGLFAMEGWALGYLDRPIERVDVRVDGVTHGTADWGFFRRDVGEVHPGIGHSFCGFSYVIDSISLSNGPHTIDIVAIDKASHQAVLGGRSITVQN